MWIRSFIHGFIYLFINAVRQGTLSAARLLWSGSKVLYSCESWSLTLREEHRLEALENKQRHKITGKWRKLHNAELHALFSSPNINMSLKSRRLGWAGHVARVEKSKGAYRVLV